MPRVGPGPLALIADTSAIPLARTRAGARRSGSPCMPGSRCSGPRPRAGSARDSRSPASTAPSPAPPPSPSGPGHLVDQPALQPPDFLPRLRELTHRHGILLVTDEVQSGMGRTGRMLAAEHWNVQPDVVCLAKGLASGMPLGAFVARSEHMSWAPGSHGSTFGGNPVACAAALATLDLL